MIMFLICLFVFLYSQTAFTYPDDPHIKINYNIYIYLNLLKGTLHEYAFRRIFRSQFSKNL